MAVEGMMMRWRHITWVFLFLTSLAGAQDIHFVHFDGTGPLLSPAEAGSGQGNLRVSAGHRSQWASITVPFRSNHVSADGFLRLGQHGWRLGWGLSLQQDDAGDAGFGTAGGLVSASLSMPLKKDHRLMAGLAGGYMQRRFDRDKLYFDEQFNGLTFDPGIIPADLAGAGPVTFPDLALGLAWAWRPPGREEQGGGLAVHHPHHPGLSHLEDNSVNLDVRWSAYYSGTFEMDGGWLLQPRTRLMLQGTYFEWLLGAWMTPLIADALPEHVSVEAGLFTRAADALILGIGGNAGAWRAAMSYELNYSGLRPATGWRGGWEVNLVYQPGRLSSSVQRHPGCYIL